MGAFVFPISTLNDYVSKYGVMTAEYAYFNARGMNSKVDICTLRCTRQILLALYNNVPDSLQDQIQYPMAVVFNGKLTTANIQCLFSKLADIINKFTPVIPPLFPPNHLQWTDGSNIEWTAGSKLNWH